MRAGSYYRLWFATAFPKAWAWTETVTGAVALVVAILAKKYPDWGPIVNDLAWQIPVGVLVLVFVVRLALAPWLMARDKASDVAEAETRLRHELQRLQEQINDRKPRLTTAIEGVITGIYRTETVLTAIVTTRNEGAPSIAELWTVWLTPQRGVRVRLPTPHVLGDKTFHMASGQKVVLDQPIYEKTVLHWRQGHGLSDVRVGQRERVGPGRVSARSRVR